MIARRALTLPGASASIATAWNAFPFMRSAVQRSHCCCSSTASSSGAASADGTSDGLRMVYEPPSKQISFRPWIKKRRERMAKDVKTAVDVMVEGKPLHGTSMAREKAMTALAGRVGTDAGTVVKAALLQRAARDPKYKLPRAATLSLVLCDDAHIASLNATHRGKDGPTDVLSFEMDDDLDYTVRLPLKLLGDVVVSLDTAARQAAERGHSLEDEIRVLLVHGTLHLCGYDHERGEQELLDMAAAEQAIMTQLGWSGQGLITAVGAADADGDAHRAPSTPAGGNAAGGKGFGAPKGPATAAAGIRKRPLQSPAGGSGNSAGSLGVLGNIFGSSGAAGGGSSSGASSSGAKASRVQQDSTSTSTRTSAKAAATSSTGKVTPASTAASRAMGSSSSSGAGQAGRGLDPQEVRKAVKLVALDMDGTLLNSSSRIPQSAVDAIRAVIAARRKDGVRVVLATGKARPAALLAARAAGLEGEELLVSHRSPGVFLQGLQVHGSRGEVLTDAALPPAVVADAFRYLEQAHPKGDVSLCAFLGDECATLRMTDDLQALHSVYYEPLARVEHSLETLLAGPPVKKLLFMSTPQVVEAQLKPRWKLALQGGAASPLQAVPNMLEVVPAGVDKWSGLLKLLKHLNLTPAQLMAVGDGGNDLGMVANAGFGIAMGNAVPKVKGAAKHVVRDHDSDGIAEALQMLL